LRAKGPLDLKAHPSKRHEGEIMTIAKSPVITMTPTAPIHDAIQIMAKEGFRRIPVANPGTKRLRGVVTASDIIDYLGGGKRFQIIQRKYGSNFFKAINESVRAIMAQEVVSISTLANIGEAIEVMKEHGIGGLPVVDEESRVWGIVTERDVVMLFTGKISGVNVADLMSKRVVVATPETSIFEAEKTMIEHGFRRLPIVSNDRLRGIVTAMDILRFFGLGEVFKRLRSESITQVLQTTIFEIATKDVATIEPHIDVGQAAKLMRERNVGALPVVENGGLTGIITERDFFKLIA